MASAGMRWALRALVTVGFALVLNGSASRADDEKPDPLRTELLKLNSVTGDDAQRTKLLSLIKDKEKAKKLVLEASKMMKEAKGKDEKPFNSNGLIMVARLAHFNKQYDIAEPFYEQLVTDATKLKSASKMATATKGLLGLYWDTKRYSLASELCEKYLAGTGPLYAESKGYMLEQWIRSLAKEEKFDESMKLIELLNDDKEMQWYVLQLKGWVHREQGKLPAAIDAYNESLDKLDANKKLKAEEKDELKDIVRYTLTGLYVENKDVDKAAKQLQTLIKRHPDNPTYKNDLGFIWCDNDKNLEESEKLITEAIDLDKKEKEKAKKEGKIEDVTPNAAYLDSLGWVLFKQKKYKEALVPLKQASADAEDGSHLEIWDHLADCYMALGQRKEAIATWQKGLKYEDLSKRDSERRRKVSEKLRDARKIKD